MARGRPSFRERQLQAAKAKERMAKRSKRARWMKKYKKTLIYCIVGFVAFIFLVFFTPYGPDYYYGKLQEEKWASSPRPGQQREIAPGYTGGMYKLAKFYSYTLRAKEAARIYDEIAVLYYGFKFTDFSINPTQIWDKAALTQEALRSGTIQGPPFKIPDEDLGFVGLALYEAAVLVSESGRSKQFASRLFNDLYMNDFYENHPEACDPAITDLARAMANRLTGRQ